jgi:hypothetical protein
MRRALALCATCALALVAVVGAAPAPAASLRFRAPVVLPGSEGGSEPSLAIDLAGNRYASWQSPGEFAVSPDGVHFSNAGMPDASTAGDVTNAVDASGALYNAQICADAFALHSCLYRSLDGGRTWPLKSEPADMHPGAADRPWIDVYPHSGTEANPDLTRVYLQYHTFSPDDLTYVTVSSDGGRTFSPPRLISQDTNALGGSFCNTIPSGIVAEDRTGWVYALWLSGNDVGANLTTGCNYSQIGPFNQAWVSVSKDGGATWSSHLAWKGAFDSATKVGDNASKIFGSITVDRAHQIHLVLPVRHHDDPLGFVQRCETDPKCKEDAQPTDLMLVTSPDGGARWTQPVRVGAARGSYFFPATVSGARGIVDTAYYVSPSLRPNDPASVWYAGFSQVTRATARAASGRATGPGAAAYTSKPVVVNTLLDRAPAHRAGICTFGVFCAAVPNSNRRLADAIAIALDRAGGANATWTNDARDATRRILFSCQIAGTSAYTGRALVDCYHTDRPALVVALG